jgi:anti-anti-sigma regulatory factor/HAMP domain-containing protein
VALSFMQDRSIRVRLLVVLASVAVVSIGAVAVVSYRLGLATLEQQAFDRLNSVRELKGRQVEGYFRTIRDQILTHSENRMIVDAVREFAAAASTLEAELGATETSERDLSLRLYYQDEFLPRLEERSADAGPLSAYWPEDALARSLQHLFISASPFAVGSKQLLDDSGAGVRYDEVHGRYHPLIRSFLERFGYYDVFLVDAATDRIVYSVFKEVDFGTSLETGPYRSSNLAAAYRVARDSGVDSFTRLEDFESYRPSYDAPASFISSPIFDGEEMLGVLVFQLPLDRINDVMTSGRAWREVGLGASGEAYLVGSDRRLRTESRFLLENAEEYLSTITAAGIAEATVRSIGAQNSAIGLQPVRTEGVDRALAGETGTGRFSDYRDVEVFSSYGPLVIADLEWVLMSEIDASEALAPLVAQRNRMLLALVIFLPLLAGLAFWFAGNLVRPIEALSRRAEELARGGLDHEVEVSRGDEIGALARSFESMRVALRDQIDRQNRSIEALSTPLIPIHDDVVVMPLVGELDEARCESLRESLTAQLHNNGARSVILDLTGVVRLDNDVARGLIRIARTARLVGAQAIVSGVRPELAAQLADGDVDTQGIVTVRTLRDAIKSATMDRGA